MTTTIENVSVRDITREGGSLVSAVVRWSVKNAGILTASVTIHVDLYDVDHLTLSQIEDRALEIARAAVTTS